MARPASHSTRPSILHIIESIASQSPSGQCVDLGLGAETSAAAVAACERIGQVADSGDLVGCDGAAVVPYCGVDDVFLVLEGREVVHTGRVAAGAVGLGDRA